jgi:hypothetical protein
MYASIVGFARLCACKLYRYVLTLTCERPSYMARPCRAALRHALTVRVGGRCHTGHTGHTGHTCHPVCQI